MAQIGFVRSSRKDEQRVALLPSHLGAIRRVDELLFERGYADHLGYSDDDYLREGARVADRAQVCACPIICCPKPLLSDEYFREGVVLFGWVHAVQNQPVTDRLVELQMTAVAWEDMFERGRHCFWRNNEIAGEAAIPHACLQWGRLPYECRAALIGCGNVGRGALRALERYGCHVTVYDRKTSPRLREEVQHYDLIVNAVLWDVFRTDRLLYEEDLDRMRPGSLIIDISCDPHMGIETSRATTIAEPVYWHRGILHYAVDHTPTLFFRSASESIGQQVACFADALIQGTHGPVLENATIICGGWIRDERILRFQNRTNRQELWDAQTEGVTPLLRGTVPAVM